jgi:DNA gyrase/topoisomerase IV subunit A
MKRGIQLRQKERTERNMRIVLMRIRQVPVKDIAEMMDLTDRQVRRIMSDWRKGALKEDTERAAEAARLIIETTRDDMKALSIAAAKASPADQVMIHGMRTDLVRKNAQVLRDTGVSFEGLSGERFNDPDLIRDVNTAIRSTLVEHGVASEVIEASIDASSGAFAAWGYGLEGQPDIYYPV